MSQSASETPPSSSIHARTIAGKKRRQESLVARRVSKSRRAGPRFVRLARSVNIWCLTWLHRWNRARVRCRAWPRRTTSCATVAPPSFQPASVRRAPAK